MDKSNNPSDLAHKDEKVTWGNYLSLLIAILFFSGIFASKNEWWGIFDFQTLNGNFGLLVAKVTENAGEVTAQMANFRGRGGSGAIDGFLFSLTLFPVVLFAIAMVTIFEYYGALKAARKLLTPILKPLLGIPGVAGLALIASLQSVDSGAAFTKALRDEGELNDEETHNFTALEVTSGASITNFFGSGAALFALVTATGDQANAASIGVCFGVILVFKVIAANTMRLIQKCMKKKEVKAQK